MKPEKFSAEHFEGVGKKNYGFDVSIYLPQFYTISFIKEIYYRGVIYQPQWNSKHVPRSPQRPYLICTIKRMRA